MGNIANVNIQDWSDEKLGNEYSDQSREFVRQLHSQELYTENPSWVQKKRSEQTELRIIVSPIVDSYMQLLDECTRRRLAALVYDECISMVENMLDGLSHLPRSDDWMGSWLDGWYEGHSFREVFEKNMLYLSWLWFHHQDKLDSEKPLEILSLPEHFDVESKGGLGRRLYSRKCTFEKGHFMYVSGHSEWSEISRKWLEDSRIIEPYNDWWELSEIVRGICRKSS